MRALTRDDAKVADRWWRDRVEVVEGDAGSARDPGRPPSPTSTSPTTSCTRWTARADFVERDRELARTFGRAADGGRGRPHRLPLRAAPRPGAAERPPRLPGRGRRPADGQRRADRGAPGGDHPRLGVGVVRDAAPPHDPAAGDGHARSGSTTGSSRSPCATCCTTSSRAADLPPEVNRTFDIGGPGGAHLPRDDPALRRRSPGCARRHRHRAGAHALPRQPVGRASSRPVPTGVAKPLVGSLLHEVVCAEHDLDDLVGPPPGGAAALRPSRGRRHRRRRRAARAPSRARSTPRASPPPTPRGPGGRGSGGS